MSLTTTERAELCDSFEEFGPDAPTLCEGWTTRDLLAHLLVRERRPDGAAGMFVPFLRKHAADVTKSFADQPWEDMIKLFREGPPMLSVWAIPVVGDKANLGEFFIHHEDVRRAADVWAPRDGNEARDEALWKPLKLMGRVLFRKSPVGVTLRSAGREDIVAKKAESGVILVGLPGEIVIHASGRPLDKVRLVVQGDPADIEAFEASPRGM
ncbi:MAG: TIGR03085 family metal-binding protein [Ilumatobacteraceae bacterium]